MSITVLMVVARGWGKLEKGGYFLMGIELQFYKMKRTMAMDGGDNRTLQMYLIPVNGTLKSGLDGKFKSGLDMHSLPQQKNWKKS